MGGGKKAPAVPTQGMSGADHSTGKQVRGMHPDEVKVWEQRNSTGMSVIKEKLDREAAARAKQQEKAAKMDELERIALEGNTRDKGKNKNKKKRSSSDDSSDSDSSSDSDDSDHKKKKHKKKHKKHKKHKKDDERDRKEKKQKEKKHKKDRS